MLIAVISDTHFGSPPKWLDHAYAAYLAPADVLLHCGDITGPATWSYFLQHPNFHCVRGNCDWAPELADALEPMLSLTFGSLQVGMAHGWGPRSRVSHTVVEAFGSGYDLICYGHTHIRDWSTVGGVRVCNPGSFGESGSLAYITVEANKALSCEFLRAH